MAGLASAVDVSAHGLALRDAGNCQATRVFLCPGRAAAEQTMSHFDDVATANCAPLDWVNFLLADVQGGVGPFLAVFLTSSQHWQAGAAGMALTVGGIATVLARAPAGELVDVLHAKRTLIALASA